MSESQAQPRRRGFLLGAATAGVATAAVTALPKTDPVPEPVTAEQPPPPERGGGYHASEHVQRYYRTTRL